LKQLFTRKVAKVILLGLLLLVTYTASPSLTRIASPFSIQSSSTTTKWTQTGVIDVSVGSVVVFVLIVGLFVFLFFNYCYRHKNALNNNNNNNDNKNNNNFHEVVS
jgi:hypothetical protein